MATGERPLCPAAALIPARVRGGIAAEGGNWAASRSLWARGRENVSPPPKHGCSALLFYMQRAAQTAHWLPLTSHVTHLDTIVFLYKNSARKFIGRTVQFIGLCIRVRETDKCAGPGLRGLSPKWQPPREVRSFLPPSQDRTRGCAHGLTSLVRFGQWCWGSRHVPSEHVLLGRLGVSDGPQMKCHSSAWIRPQQDLLTQLGEPGVFSWGNRRTVAKRRKKQAQGFPSSREP